MTFTTGLTIQELGNILPSTFVKFASTLSLKHIEFDPTVFNDIENVIDTLKTQQTTLHAPYVEDYGMDLSSNNDEVDQFIENILQTKKNLRIIGTIVHPPTDGSGSLDIFYDRIERLPFPLLENMPYQSWEEYQDFFETTRSNVSNDLGMCFDIPHSYITHGENFLDIPDACLELLQTPRGYIHVSGSTQVEDTHFPLLTEGDMPIDPIKRFLKKINFSGVITMELAPRSLNDVEKIIQSYMLMLGIAKKQRHKVMVMIKKPFIMRRIKQLSKRVTPEDFIRKGKE
ncbi:MAG: TIM barrel protein [Candidatus Hodarchaeota archaeon]